jgi:hypothetical protein
MNGSGYLSAWGFSAENITAMWHARPLRTAGADGRFRDHGAVAWDELAAAAAARAEVLAVHHNGAILPVSAYSRSAVVAGAEREGLLDSKALEKLTDAGATVIAANVEQYITHAGSCASALGRHCAASVEAHAFRTPPQAPGIPAHSDGEDNFLLQVHGQKQWQLWQPPTQAKMHYNPAELGDPDVDIVIEAGDALYIPPGWPHHGCAGPAGSFHITYQVLPLLVRDMLEEHLSARIESAFGAYEQIQVPAQLFGNPALNAFIEERLASCTSRLWDESSAQSR